MAGTGEDDAIVGPRVQNVLRIIANLSPDEVQQVFISVATFPPVCAAVLNRTAAILTTVFGESRRDFREGSDKPRRQSERLKKAPPTPSKKRSARKKQKSVSVDSSSEEWHCDEDTGDTAEEDSINEEDEDTGGDGGEDTRAVGVEFLCEAAAKAAGRATQTQQKSEVFAVPSYFCSHSYISFFPFLHIVFPVFTLCFGRRGFSFENSEYS